MRSMTKDDSHLYISYLILGEQRNVRNQFQMGKHLSSSLIVIEVFEPSMSHQLRRNTIC